MVGGGRSVRALCCLALLFLPACGRKASDGASAPETGTATEHLPAGCDVVVRIDIKALLAMEGVKVHVAEMKRQAPADASSKGRLAVLDFLRIAQLDPASDLSEASVCLRRITAQTQSDPKGGVRHVIALSGNVPRGKVVEALLSRGTTGQYQALHLPGLEAVRAKAGRLLAQAPDGTILISDDQDLLLAARDPGRRHLSYGLASGEVSLAATKQALASLGAIDGDQRPTHPFAALLGQAERLDIGLHAGQSLLDATLQLGSPQQAIQSERRLTDFVAMLKDGPTAARLGQLLPPGTMDALAATRISRVDNKAVLQIHLPETAVGELFHRVALIGAFGS